MNLIIDHDVKRLKEDEKSTGKSRYSSARKTLSDYSKSDSIQMRSSSRREKLMYGVDGSNICYM